jgi:hypothetical protein
MYPCSGTSDDWLYGSMGVLCYCFELGTASDGGFHPPVERIDPIAYPNINALLYLAEMSDIASLFLPKPYMILAGTRDKIFPIAGARQIAAVIKHNYELAGVPERFRFAEFDEEHGYQASLRQAAYGWLRRWLLDDGGVHRDQARLAAAEPAHVRQTSRLMSWGTCAISSCFGKNVYRGGSRGL